MPVIVAYACEQDGVRETSLEIDLDSGLMRGARQVPSPNCDARPPDSPMDLIVVHGISLPPYFAEISGLRVSSHLVIARDGALTQYVSFNDRAWHAGRSSFQGRIECNDYSVGVELEGTDSVPYEPVQYEVLASTVAALCEAYPLLTPARMAGHSDVAPGRKTDPGPVFDWKLAHRCIAEKVAK
jgi:AmpD protein